MKKHNLSVAAALVAIVAAAGSLIANNQWFLDAWGKWFEAYAWLFSSVPALIASILGWKKAKAAQEEAQRVREEAEDREAKGREQVTIYIENPASGEILETPFKVERKNWNLASASGALRLSNAGSFFDQAVFGIAALQPQWQEIIDGTLSTFTISDAKLFGAFLKSFDKMGEICKDGKRISVKVGEFTEEQLAKQAEEAAKPRAPKPQPPTLEQIREVIIECIETDHCLSCKQPKEEG